ncbi:type II toxin-antitoxin system VapC family toxin [Lacihabitans sp. LS3-19]|uniref:PIN domain-containing protein n=1 Tax=Lacihabitans sp. LS3-19 TaxID=2487335 RepID=UPI0020CDD00D|nr:PIN domain-containing protein [Lacihabitans sp. LS3-19]MCP9768989.1 type II toxin-antitoxin system VapC family toxin [Lacihabitans sp. LS3-19]
MIYLDTDFLIHYLVIQDKEIHRIVNKKIKPWLESEKVFISLLTMQETSFVLSRLNFDSFEIIEKINQIERFGNINYSKKEFERAKFLASKVGFNSINDCLHTAIAESHCKELYTFNKKDFEKIKNYTDLKINILSV